LRIWLAPCCPGAKSLRDTAHFSVEQRVPFKNIF
jgi:hypothetical protein